MNLWGRFQRGKGGFTLIEILVVLAIIGILGAVIYIPLKGLMTETREMVALRDLQSIESELAAYFTSKGQWPDSLADIGRDGLKDPWGNPYTYLRIEGSKTPGLNGKKRRDKNLNPVNTDYDLYSNGPDGKTAAQFMAGPARDDLVRANNGRYFGVAQDHVPL